MTYQQSIQILSIGEDPNLVYQSQQELIKTLIYAGLKNKDSEEYNFAENLIDDLDNQKCKEVNNDRRTKANN